MMRTQTKIIALLIAKHENFNSVNKEKIAIIFISFLPFFNKNQTLVTVVQFRFIFPE
jgi:hypothetical protein